jgi:phage repressor protein C with HTH and peptisase S24 domain
MGQSRTVREVIRDHIDAEGPATPKQVAEGTGENYNTVRSTMNRMKGNELDLLNAEKGVYDLSERIQPSDTSARNRDAPRDPIYPAVASAGDGSYDISEDPIGYIQGENALSRPGRDVFWMPVRGDSMDDTLPKGGLVPVQRFDPTWTELREDDVYLFRLEGAIQIKRLQRRPGARIRVVSDNDNYDDFNIALDDGVDFEILGRVLV